MAGTMDGADRRGRGMLSQMPLYVGGRGGYHTYRIPALLRTQQGTLLAYCEGRRESARDDAETDLLMRRSTDGGATWSDVQCVARRVGYTCGNPCPVQDRDTGTIWLPFTQNPAGRGEELVLRGESERTVWLTWSGDDGQTWAEAVEITEAVKPPSWTWYATGPGHGIQLRGGRLLIPCDHVVAENYRRDDPHRSHVIYSDDHGRSWQVGGHLADGSNECLAVETADGWLYVNARNYLGIHSRLYAWSDDGGESFGATRRDDTLVTPVCQAGLLALNGKDVLFSNPAATERRRLMVRLSEDGGRTWPRGRVLHEGPAAYSDLAVAGDTVCCLYECGRDHPYETLTLARFGLDWLRQREAVAR